MTAAVAWSTRKGSTASIRRSPTGEPPIGVPEDGDGDEQADDGIGSLPAQGDRTGANRDGDASEPVGAGVQSVSDQGSTPGCGVRR
jgi:hypothetical protein